MKLITAYVHRNRAGHITQALADAGYGNFALVEVRGTLPPLNADEQQYSTDGSRITTAEVRVELVCQDADVDAVTGLIRMHGRIGAGVSGLVYVSPIDQVLMIGDPM